MENLYNIRAENEELYYQNVALNPSLDLFLRPGEYTKPDERIVNLSDYLWEHETVTFSDGSALLIASTENSIVDYVNRSLAFVAGEIENGKVLYMKYDEYYKKVYQGQIPAAEILEKKVGACDEKAILFKSLMLAKGIPTQIKIYQNNEVAHAQNLVYLPWNGSYRWVKVDPSGGNRFDRWTLDKGVDITNRDTIFASNVERW
jgi:hypothetical protein